MRFLAAIFATVLIAYGLSYYLTVPANSEISFWHEVVLRRDKEIANLKANEPNRPIIFFTGGSSTAFSIEPQIIEESCGISTFNLGLPLAAGGHYLIHQAMRKARSGDALIICLEPDVLTGSGGKEGASKFSFALSSKEGSPAEAAGGDTFALHPPFRDYLNLSRPGVGHVTTLLAKSIVGRGYRYTSADIRYHGRIETATRNQALVPIGPGTATKLSHEGRALLETAKLAASRRGIRLAYSMPWHFTAAEKLEESRAVKRTILEDIGSIIPIIEDGYYGSASERNWFSDSTQHLTAEGSKIRSTALASAMNHWLKAK